MPRKGENIYKRKDGRWEGRYIIERIPNQKSKYGYVYAHSYNDVKKKLIEAKYKLQQEQNNTSPDSYMASGDSISGISIKELAEKWLDYKRMELKPSSIYKYTVCLQSYMYPFIGDQNITSITKADLDHYVSLLLKEGSQKNTRLSSKTVNDVLSILKSIAKYATDCGYSVPAVIYNMRIHQSSKTLYVLSRVEQNLLMDYLIENSDDLRNIGILLCLMTGIRLGELCGLCWENINLNQEYIYITQILQRLPVPSESITSSKSKTYVAVSTPKSACSIRKIPLPPKLIMILRSHYREDGYLLTGSTSNYIEPRSMQNHFKSVLQAINIEETHFHTLRHTFATRCVELGFDIKSLSEILGHASVNITMNRYVHPSMELKQEHMNRLDDLFTVR